MMFRRNKLDRFVTVKLFQLGLIRQEGRSTTIPANIRLKERCFQVQTLQLFCSQQFDYTEISDLTEKYNDCKHSSLLMQNAQLTYNFFTWQKSIKDTNTLAYSSVASVRNKKSFIRMNEKYRYLHILVFASNTFVKTMRCNIKLFTAVISALE